MYASGRPLLSLTTKDSGCSSTCHGGGYRRRVAAMPDGRTKEEQRQTAVLKRRRLDSRIALHIFAPMPSVLRELRRRVRAEKSLPRFEPSLPRVAHRPPAGPGWIHEIKHDGFASWRIAKGVSCGS